MIPYEIIQPGVHRDVRVLCQWVRGAMAGTKKPPRTVAGGVGRSEDGDQPTRGGKGLALEGGTEVRALFISIDRKV